MNCVQVSQNLTIESSPVRGNHVHIPFKKDSFVKADSDAAATGNAESEHTRMLFLDFLYNNSIVNILPICII